jgi:acyl carrier protein
MERAVIQQKLQEIMERSVGDSIGAIDETKNLQTDLRLDSMDVVTMAIEIESEFRIELKAAELSKLVLVKDLIDLIVSKIPSSQAQAA